MFYLEFCFKLKYIEVAIVIFSFFLTNLQTKEGMKLLRGNGLRANERKFCRTQKTSRKQQTTDAR